MASVLLYFLHLYVFFLYVFGSKDILTTVVIKIKSICTTTRITAKTFQLTFYEITLQNKSCLYYKIHSSKTNWILRTNTYL